MVCVAIYHVASPQAKWIYNEEASISAATIILVLSLGQLTDVVIEHSAIKSAQFNYMMGIRYQLYQFVFVDESSCDRRTSYRGRAWAFRGQRVV
jgi:hypothetical protein